MKNLLHTIFGCRPFFKFYWASLDSYYDFFYRCSVCGEERVGYNSKPKVDMTRLSAIMIMRIGIIICLLIVIVCFGRINGFW